MEEYGGGAGGALQLRVFVGCGGLGMRMWGEVIFQFGALFDHVSHPLAEHAMGSRFAQLLRTWGIRRYLTRYLRGSKL